MLYNYYGELFEQFKEAIVVLRSKYIAPFLVARAAFEPADYAFEVKSFCVFSHAALEYLFESWATAYAEFVVEEWKSHGTESAAITALIMYHGRVSDKLYKTSEKAPTYAALRRHAVENALDSLKVYISDRNNGIGVTHMRRLFWPLNIEITDSLRFESSLAQLKKLRGSYAHTFNRSSNKAPEDADKIVSDCLDLAGELESALSFETFGSLCNLDQRKLLRILAQRFHQLSN